MKTRFVLACALAAAVPLARAASLTESTFTEVIKDVNVVELPTKTTKPAKVSGMFKAPDLVRTGADSRTELTATDQTITRVGANTVFSFEPVGRDIKLEQGSILFHSPKGKGGSTIKTGGASAAVLGTTIIVAATPNGGFKFIVLEGRGKATLLNGKSVKLKAGQMVFILPGGKNFSPVLDINLAKLVGGSQLIGGFSRELPSIALINAAIQAQNRELARGRAEDTGMSPEQFASRPRVENGLDAVDPNSYQTAVPPPVTFQQLGGLLQGQGGAGGAGLILVLPGRQTAP